MELVLFTGIPASGKSSFYKERFFNSHVRVSLDLLKMRSRERKLLQVCFDSLMPVVVDYTNVTVAERNFYIRSAKQPTIR